ncbi:MAG: hypothetical protein KAF91_25290 [Nostoc sp. TH1S01]|nr:hypothetical protein [Nostoc sp. TH1S01]
MKNWSKVRIFLLAVNLGCVIIVLVNVIQRQSLNKPKLEEFRREAYVGELHTAEINSQYETVILA